MSRYFFHVRDGGDFIRDETGGTFDTLSEAHHEAIKLAQSYAKDMGEVGGDTEKVTIEVCDDAGAVLRTVDASQISPL